MLGETFKVGVGSVEGSNGGNFQMHRHLAQTLQQETGNRLWNPKAESGQMAFRSTYGYGSMDGLFLSWLDTFFPSVVRKQTNKQTYKPEFRLGCQETMGQIPSVSKNLNKLPNLLLCIYSWFLKCSRFYLQYQVFKIVTYTPTHIISVTCMCVPSA